MIRLIEGTGSVDLLKMCGRLLSLNTAGVKLLFADDTVTDVSSDSKALFGIKSDAHGGLYRLLIIPSRRPFNFKPTLIERNQPPMMLFTNGQ